MSIFTRRIGSTQTYRIEETLEAFQQVVTSGKARYIGFSEWKPEQIQAAIRIVGAELFVSSQVQYSLLWQAPEAEIFPQCAAHGISQIVWAPLAQGMLTGKYRSAETPPGDSRVAKGGPLRASMLELVMNDATLAAVDRLRPIADGAGLSMVEMALPWTMRRRQVASAIAGASLPEQVHANAIASGIELTADTLKAIDQVLGDAGALRAAGCQAPLRPSERSCFALGTKPGVRRNTDTRDATPPSSEHAHLDMSDDTAGSGVAN
jgi:aryl-alcohol dehydrogenase-like predicted oxidoreductase